MWWPPTVLQCVSWSRPSKVTWWFLEMSPVSWSHVAGRGKTLTWVMPEMYVLKCAKSWSQVAMSMITGVIAVKIQESYVINAYECIIVCLDGGKFRSPDKSAHWSVDRVCVGEGLWMIRLSIIFICILCRNTHIIYTNILLYVIV